jgi:hypothetical protein
MKKDLAIKQIFDDFTDKIMLSDNEKDVLQRYIKNDSIVKIANDTMQGTATISRIIASIKEKYDNYKKLEIAKLMLLTNKKDK